MSLFNFFRNTLHEVVIMRDDNYPDGYPIENVICKNYLGEKKGRFSKWGPLMGGTDCTHHCKHCVGCTIRYTSSSYEDCNKDTQCFVKCKCGHNNIFNIWRRIKYVLSGKRAIIKVITKDGIKQIN